VVTISNIQINVLKINSSLFYYFNDIIKKNNGFVNKIITNIIDIIKNIDYNFNK